MCKKYFQKIFRQILQIQQRGVSLSHQTAKALSLAEKFKNMATIKIQPATGEAKYLSNASIVNVAAYFSLSPPPTP